MAKIMNFLQLFIITMLLIALNVMEGNSENYDENLTAEGRLNKRRRRPVPCRVGKSGSQGRTFFDWAVQYQQVNNNFINNYNTICNGAGDGIPMKPIVGSGGGGLLGSHLGGGGNGLFGSHFNGGGLLGSHLGGIGNHFASHVGNGNQNNGPLGFGFWPLLFGTSGNIDNDSGGSSSSSSSSSSSIFNQLNSNNQEKPVHENIDSDIVPEGHNRPLRPGHYVMAYNPLLGTYVQDLSNFNPNRIIKQANRKVNQALRPLYNLF